MATTKEQKVTLQTAVNLAKEAFNYVKTDIGFNRMIERYQVANANGQYDTDSRVSRLEEFRKKIDEAERKFRGTLDENKKPLVSVANWGPVAEFFNKSLAHMKKADFAAEAANNAARDLKRAKLHIPSKEEKDVIIAYHNNRVEKTWEQVEQFRIILEKKGLLHKAKMATPEQIEKAAINE